MNIEVQQRTFEEFIAKMESTIFKKGNDYSKGDADRLSNFKLAGAITGSSPQMNCLNLIATKVARLGVLLNKEGSPDNESIEDSILDLANYAVLLNMLQIDTVEKKSEKDIQLQTYKGKSVTEFLAQLDKEEKVMHNKISSARKDERYFPYSDIIKERCEAELLRIKTLNTNDDYVGAPS
jgi:hypothetical protein